MFRPPFAGRLLAANLFVLLFAGGCALLFSTLESAKASPTLPRRIADSTPRVGPPPRPETEADVYAKLLTWYLTESKAWGDKPGALKAADLVAVSAPAPTGSSFHNGFAPKWRVEKAGLRVWADKGAKDSAEGQKYALSYDVNLAELKQIQAEMKSKRFATALIPVTRRYPVDEGASSSTLAKVAKAYGLEPGYKPEYRSSWVDLNGNEYRVFGVTAGSRLRILIARVRK